METSNPVLQLCVASTEAEYAGQLVKARALAQAAWQAATTDLEACVAAHYVARYQEDPKVALQWQQEALARADAVGDGTVAAFYPSIYLNLGHAYERLGDKEEAQRYYRLAAAMGMDHDADGRAARPRGDG
jgi:hypothetical protein